MEHCENICEALLEQSASCTCSRILGIATKFTSTSAETMPPRRTAIPAPTTPTRASSSAAADDAEETKQEIPTTPSPLKRRLAELTEQRKQQRSGAARGKGVRLTKFSVDGEIVAFSVMGVCTDVHVWLVVVGTCGDLVGVMLCRDQGRPTATR